MKIVYCIDSLIPSGGTERVLTTKLNYLAETENIKVWVVTLSENKPSFFTISEKVERIMLDVNCGDKRTYRRELEILLSDLCPDITVCVDGMALNVLPKLTDGSVKVLEFHYTKNFLVNFVKGIHSIRFRQLHLLKMRWFQWQLAQIAKKYKCFVGLTKRDVDLWGTPKNMAYIYNPLSFRSERKSTCDNHQIIAVGSLTPAKGMDQLIEAFGRIAHRYPDWKLDIYGDGQDKKLLLSIIVKYAITEQVTLHKPCRNIKEKLLESSIYAFPSRSDGFGLVITEAMECGLPTVAMDCECGPCEILSSSSGILVPDKNIEAFTSALEQLMNDNILRKTMGNTAQKEVIRFYPENIMPQWINLFKSLVIKD